MKHKQCTRPVEKTFDLMEYKMALRVGYHIHAKYMGINVYVHFVLRVATSVLMLNRDSSSHIYIVIKS